MSAPAERPGIGRRALVVVVVVAAASLIFGLLLMALGPDAEPKPSAASDAFSRSAIGHHAFVELLRDLEIPVLISHGQSARRAGERALLVVAEPSIPPRETDRAANRARGRELAAMLKRRTGRTLLVLPKWRGAADRSSPGWVEQVAPIPVAEVRDVLEHGDVRGVRVMRPDPVGRPRVRGDLDAGEPTLRWAQLLVDDQGQLEPIISCPEGILFAEFVGRRDPHRLFILADPDLISNHGLLLGANADVAVAAVRMARPSEEAAVILDETLHDHGLGGPESFWKQLFSFPLALTLAQVIVGVLAFVWAGAGRFGAAVPVPPPIEPGKRVLIDNTAELLRFGGHTHHILSRYYRATVREVARRLHAPPEMGGAELREWLERVGKARGVSIGLRAIEADLADLGRHHRGREHQLVAVATRIHRWRRGMLHER